MLSLVWNITPPPCFNSNLTLSLSLSLSLSQHIATNWGLMKCSNCNYLFFFSLPFKTSPRVHLLKQLCTRRFHILKPHLFYFCKEKVIITYVPFNLYSILARNFLFSLCQKENKAIVYMKKIISIANETLSYWIFQFPLIFI